MKSKLSIYCLVPITLGIVFGCLSALGNSQCDPGDKTKFYEIMVVLQSPTVFFENPWSELQKVYSEKKSCIDDSNIGMLSRTIIKMFRYDQPHLADLEKQRVKDLNFFSLVLNSINQAGTSKNDIEELKNLIRNCPLKAVETCKHLGGEVAKYNLVEREKQKQFLVSFFDEIKKTYPGSARAVLKRDVENLSDLHMKLGLDIRNEKLRHDSTWEPVKQFYQKNGFSQLDDISSEFIKDYQEYLLRQLSEKQRMTLLKEQKDRKNQVRLLFKLRNECTKQIEMVSKDLEKCIPGADNIAISITKEGQLQIGKSLPKEQASCLKKVTANISFKSFAPTEEIAVQLPNLNSCTIKKLEDFWNE